MKGYYIFEPTTLSGNVMKRSRPMTIGEVRSELPHALKIDSRTLEFAIAVTQQNPAVPYVLSGTMEVPDPLGIEKGLIGISWTAHLTWFVES